eukprot:GHVS01045703.1.p1 GENE.GHVS01045703.1~~GHVS01045703.1.p1  ORF type:complete len:198 (-),score=22.66 GHVS01045703.1:65-616(-)
MFHLGDCTSLTETTPRLYQVIGFAEALQRNVVVVIPTGGGKTLIAAMLIKKMVLANPGKMGLILVDRIPLVFQQGHALKDETELQVCMICGETKTAYTVKQVRSGTIYDVLVITAGVFLECLYSSELSIEEFCVVCVDEVHHARGNHPYCNVGYSHILANLFCGRYWIGYINYRLQVALGCWA